MNIEAPITIDYSEAFKRSRKVSEQHVKGIHYLMKKNKIDEIDSSATFTVPNAM